MAEPELTEEPKNFLKFRASQKSPTMDIGVGEYRRTFNAGEQPFEVKDAEEEQLLRNTGFFVSDKEAQAEADAEAEIAAKAEADTKAAETEAAAKPKVQPQKSKVKTDDASTAATDVADKA
jgi:hypothetical protein